MSLTIPAPCIEALGGMQDSDPPVLMQSGLHTTPRHPCFPAHGQRNGPHAKWRLLVEQSAPALLRVLARHLGWDGSHLLELHTEWWDTSGGKRHYRWRLRCVSKSGGVPVRHVPTGAFCVWLPDHISTDLDYLEALAEAVIWYARVARMGCDFTGSPERLTLAELHSNTSTPTWAVQR